MIIWKDYMIHRIETRGFNSKTIEGIVRFTDERYRDAVTGRLVAIGRHDRLLVMIPYEKDGDDITPVTIHSTSRQQINLRINTGRFEYE